MAASGPAQAQGDFERCLKEAVGFYENLELEQALEQLECAKQLARGPEQEVAAALHEGAILASMGKREQALALFERALRMNPEAELPIRDAPKVVQDFEQVRSRVRASALATPSASRGPPERATRPPVVWVDRPELPRPPLNGLTPAHPFPQIFMPLEEEGHVRPSISRVPVVPLVMGGVGVMAAGVGAVFGVQSRARVSDARAATFQDEAQAHLDDARGQARLANALFGTAGLAATGAIVTWLMSLSDSDAPDSKEVR